MKASRYIGLLLSLAFPVLAADRNSRSEPVKARSTNVIDTDKGIYGTAFGTSEEKFIATYGEPTGHLRLSAKDTALIYGKDHAFLFKNNQLIGARITENIFDWKISRELTNTTQFDEMEWKLDNGIHKGMTLADVQKIVGKNIANNKYTFAYRAGRTTVEIDFVQQDLEFDQNSTVLGLLIKRE